LRVTAWRHAATESTRQKLIILDPCRDKPIGLVCPNLQAKKLSFSRIEPGAMRGAINTAVELERKCVHVVSSAARVG
jgi:hypothetical protein